MNRAGMVLGEFIVVVLGVLVALAVDGIAADRRDRALGQQYIDNLRRDMHTDTLMDRIYTDVAGRKAEGLRAALRALDEPARSIADADLLLALNFAIFDLNASTVLLDEPTYTDLLNTGNLRLLDPTLRAALVRFRTRRHSDATRVAALNFPFSQHGGFIPGVARMAMRDCYRDCASPTFTVPAGRLRALADSLVRDFSDAERATLRSWRSLPGVRMMLEDELFSVLLFARRMDETRPSMMTALEALDAVSGEQGAGERAR